MIQIGTSIRHVNDTLEGVVTSFLTSNVIEFEDSNGFRRIARLQDVVETKSGDYFEVEGKSTDSHGQPDTEQQAPTTDQFGMQLVQDEGLLGMEFGRDVSGKKVSVFLVNASPWRLLVLFSRIKGDRRELLLQRIMGPVERVMADICDVDESELNTEWECQLLQFKEAEFEPRPPAVLRISLDPREIKVLSEQKPLLQKPSLRKTILSFSSDSARLQKLVEHFQSPVTGGSSHQSSAKSRTNFIFPKEKVVDLHIEELVKDASKMTSGQIISHQLAVFEKEMDDAFRQHLSSIVFIHGVGSGVLRSSIREALKKFDNIRYADASSQKYGHGATQVDFL